MPLAIISGYPCAGKTYRSEQIIANFKERIASSTDPKISKLKIHHINDESLGVKRDVYATARAEKDARAEEMSAVKRLLSKDSMVIADGLNYIKGFRYQLFCEAKAVQTPCCVIHIGTSQPQCKAYFDQLTSEQKPTYTPADFENLLFRYEEPNGMTRWDSPLFTVVHDDADPPYGDIWTVLIGEAKDASGQTKIVRPNAATVLKPASASDYLYELDKVTSEVVQKITEWQADHVGEEGGEVVLAGGKDEEERLAVTLPNQPLSLPQLQRVRRQFITLNRQHSLEKSRVRPLFVDYLNDIFGR